MAKRKKQSSTEPLNYVSERLQCGDYAEYVNKSGELEFATVTVQNRCEFSGYLYLILRPERPYTVKILPGTTYSETQWLPPDARIEYECSLVRTIRRDGCDFSVIVHQRVAAQ